MRVESKPARTRSLHPPIAADAQGWLDVGDGHRLYWETCGNADGRPAVFLHGGPGGGCHADHRRLFDPRAFRIVLFDQRGAGRSVPAGSIEANTTAHLVADMEQLRAALAIENWVIVGGSWGSTLALAYAQAFPARVVGLVLRGVFTARRSELDWLYRDGASALFPEAWADFIAPIPAGERHDLIAAYHRRLFGPDLDVRRQFARHWCTWEARVMTLVPRPGEPLDGFDESAISCLARLETHYFQQGAFLEEGSLIAGMDRIAHIPGAIVQGRYDSVTPPRTAFDLHRAWPSSRLDIVPDAGHASSEPGILDRLVEAIDRFAGP